MTSHIKADQVTAIEALKLFSEGHALTCPVCSAEIVSIPGTMTKGSSPLGIECPVNQRHFFVYKDAKLTMKEMRARMRRLQQK